MKALPLLLASLLLAGVVRATDAPDISHYQIIIDKSPFGAVAASGAAAVQPAFSEHLLLVAVVVSNAGAGPTQAGLFDKTANQTYFKAAGEIINPKDIPPIKVVQIELTTPPKVILQAALETATLTFQDRPTPQAPPGPTRPGMPMPNPPGVLSPAGRRPPFMRSR